MLESLIPLLLFVGASILTISLINIIGLNKITDEIAALLFLLFIITIAFDVFPIPTAISAILQEIPVIGKILDAGSIYQYGTANTTEIAVETIKMTNMLVLINLFDSLINHTSRHTLILVFASKIIVSVLASIAMNAMIGQLFVPFVETYFSNVTEYGAEALAHAFCSWFFIIILCAITVFFGKYTKAFSPLLVLKSLFQSLAFVILLIIFEYYFGTTIITAIHNVQRKLTTYLVPIIIIGIVFILIGSITIGVGPSLVLFFIIVYVGLECLSLYTKTH